MAPERQRHTKKIPLDLQRSIGAREQAKAAAPVDALAPATVKGGDTNLEATFAEASALTRDAVEVKVGAVNDVPLEASSPVVGLGGTVVGTADDMVTSTTEAILGLGTGGSVRGSGDGDLATGGSGLKSTVGSVTGLVGDATRARWAGCCDAGPFLARV